MRGREIVRFAGVLAAVALVSDAVQAQCSVGSPYICYKLDFRPTEQSSDALSPPHGPNVGVAEADFRLQGGEDHATRVPTPTTCQP